MPIIIPLKWRKFCRRNGDKKCFKQFLGRYEVPKYSKNDNLLWVHAVSVGETQVALGFIRQILQRNPNQKILLSTTTPTGQAIAQNQSPKNVLCCYAPLDFAPFVNAFLNHFSPQKLIILETEIWPNIITLTAKKGTEIYIVNGRLSDKSSQSYSRFSSIFAPMLKKINTICVQTQEDANRFHAIDGTLNVNVTGNMKLDQTIPAELIPTDLTTFFGDKPFVVLLGASTHPGEEACLLNAFKDLKKQIPLLKFVSIPRHAERGDAVEKLFAQSEFSYARISTQFRSTQNAVDLLLADTTGALLNYLASSDCVVMGKTLLHYKEGQNPIEAVLLKKPILSGEKMTNFRFIFEILKNNQGITLANSENLTERLLYMLTNPTLMKAQADRAFHALNQHHGATLNTLNIVFPSHDNKGSTQ